MHAFFVHSSPLRELESCGLSPVARVSGQEMQDEQPSNPWPLGVVPPSPSDQLRSPISSKIRKLKLCDTDSGKRLPLHCYRRSASAISCRARTTGQMLPDCLPPWVESHRHRDEPSTAGGTSEAGGNVANEEAPGDSAPKLMRTLSDTTLSPTSTALRILQMRVLG